MSFAPRPAQATLYCRGCAITPVAGCLTCARCRVRPPYSRWGLGWRRCETRVGTWRCVGIFGMHSPCVYGEHDAT